MIRTVSCLLGCALLALSAAAVAQDPPPAPPKKPGFQVVRVVFVDLESADAGTQATIDESWASLREAAKARSDLEIERLHKDTQSALAAPYLQQQPLAAVPGIYFLDAKDRLVSLLQGDVLLGQVQALLKKKR